MRKIKLERGGDRQPGQPPRTCGQNVHKWRGLSENRETKNATAQYGCGVRLFSRLPLHVNRPHVAGSLLQKVKDRQMLFLTVYLF